MSSLDKASGGTGTNGRGGVEGSFSCSDGPGLQIPIGRNDVSLGAKARCLANT